MCITLSLRIILEILSKIKIRRKKYNLKVEKIFEYRKENESFGIRRRWLQRLRTIFLRNDHSLQDIRLNSMGIFDQNIVDKESCKKEQDIFLLNLLMPYYIILQNMEDMEVSLELIFLGRTYYERKKDSYY